MIWVAWRQQRLTVLATLGLGAAIAAAMTVLRLVATSYMDDHGIAGCATAGPGCDSNALHEFYEAFGGIQTPLILLLFALPPVVGAFVGGPLFAREIERGTHVFALTQAIGRTRWWATKLAVGALPALAGMLLLGLVATWAFDPLAYLTSSPVRTPGFETQGLVVAAYTVLAFAIGSTAGLLLRNTLGAMVVTIVLYIVLLVGVGGFLREHYAEPVGRTESIGLDGPTEDEQTLSDTWQVDHAYLDAAGNEVEPQFKPDCGGPEECMRAQGIDAFYIAYHPADRFWRFQLTETALFAGVALLVVGAGAWAVRRVSN
ncbi:ABC transporter permease subunit [Phytomonospora sp. NPDC050363]|uniref:ABC transporter permease subunit n=1 Tax=Phytomonospora sp. NPDC050363 TaxID=3155642 RepID=UPI0033CE6D41